MAETNAERMRIRLREVVERWRHDLIESWVRQQRELMPPGPAADQQGLLTETERVLTALLTALDSDRPLHRLPYEEPGLRAALIEFAGGRAHAGTSPGHTAMALLALKQAVVGMLRAHAETGPAEAAETMDIVVALNRCVDAAAVLIMETYVQRRDELIEAHRQRVLELSVPVLTVGDGVVVLPLIGTLDAERAALAMETVLDVVHTRGVHTLIIDVTGASDVDDAVSGRLADIVAATRLMGARGIVCGIVPGMAQAMVAAGTRLAGIDTYADLASALAPVLAGA
ncbi:STAS domain-containing protein [Amycolatopsis viridis]|uniref:RsbT co-antagonist protein RsbR n=1 Tax=Amycolatopsis viridis TaxID=185678 RepID=A0ABX0SWJ6_9PSEU|nr:STAS domain-containing protein [Amycolatopsis viridis]NIH81308.1 rsbT co-antagonist protein RsbR [Amycolatopsis viridis]